MVKAKKDFSQNFLVDARIPQAIAAAIPLSTAHPNVVLEVGAGRGALTLPLLHTLAPADKLVAVEVEPDCLKVLNTLLCDTAQCALLGQNILGVWPDAVTVDPNQPVHVVGNLPYHMTGQILFHFCGEMAELAPHWRARLASFTLMVQQEVAERLVAQPGNAAINPLTWSIQTWFEIRLVLPVPPTAFKPRPKVQSAVIQLLPRHTPLFDAAILPTTTALIKASFRQPRKTLRNNWAAAFGPPTQQHPVWQAIPADQWDRRAHTVTQTDWQTWATAWHNVQGN
jgi:16S rRNA (adenine1518-N6/adenine1519-N6)-dimethyltransferase